MNIRELIDHLAAVAADLPAGLDTEARIHVCRGHGRFGIISRKITLDATADAVWIQGHPHLDNEITVWRPMTADADAELTQLTADPEVVPRNVPGAAIVRLGDTNRGYRMPLRSTGKILWPGEVEALRVGCLCSPENNARARAEPSSDGYVAFVVDNDCPVHQTIDLDEDQLRSLR